MMMMRGRDSTVSRYAIFSWDVLANCAEEGALSAYGTGLSCPLSLCRSPSLLPSYQLTRTVC
jgi:hypothetical protein